MLKNTIKWHIFVEIFGNYKIMPYICSIKIRDNKSNKKLRVMDTIYVSKKKAEKYDFDYNLIAAQCYFGLPARPDFDNTYCIGDAHTCPIWIKACKKEDADYSIRLRYNKGSKTYYFKKVKL